MASSPDRERASAIDEPAQEGATADTTSQTATPPLERERERSTSPAKSDKEEGEVTGTAPLPTEPVPENNGWNGYAYGSSGPWNGWWYYWHTEYQAYVWWNQITNTMQYNRPEDHEFNPSSSTSAPGATSSSPTRRPHGGYNPAIHGDYDPNADYAIAARKEEEERQAAVEAAAAQAAQAAAAAAGYPVPVADQKTTGDYAQTGAFNRFTGVYQAPGINPENHNNENKTIRQLSHYMDIDAAANSHDGRSLKEERRRKGVSKKEVQQYREKRARVREERRRAFYRD